MDRSHIHGFPNHMPHVDWLSYLPMFKDEKKDVVALHLIKFHMHIHRLKVKFPEDCLMKLFIATLEDKERTWYEWLKPSSICSLKDFHSVFFDNCREHYPSLLLVQNCCDYFDGFIWHLESIDEDLEFMDYEIIKSRHDFSSQKESKFSSLDGKECNQER